MAKLSLKFLGRFEATSNGESLTHFRTKSVQALLIYLACQPGTHRRESLMALLWPDTDQGSAQNSLRQALYHLRQAIPDVSARDGGGAVPFLLSDRQGIWINPDAAYDLDVAAFESKLRGSPAGWPQAVVLYRGDLLCDFYLPDSAPFEEWVATRRADLRRQGLYALDELADAALQDQDFAAVERYAWQQIDIDNLRDSAYYQLMTALARSGQRSAALAQYEIYRRRLDDELGVDPPAKLSELYRRIQADELQQSMLRRPPKVMPSDTAVNPIFCYTDIENSTRLWDEHREAMLVALNRHNDLIEMEVAAYNGFILHPTGDGFLIVFEQNNPLQFALELQNKFAEANWGEIGELRIRIGLHGALVAQEGHEFFREDGTYRGPVLNHAARIADTGHGGQIVASAVVKEMVPLPPGASWQDLGSHKLRSLNDDYEIYGLMHPDLSIQNFPSLRTPATKLAEGKIRGYELRHKIGQGAFGEVYLAQQPGVGRQVAVKIIRERYANQPDFIRRFEIEAQTVARLEHPHIVPLHDYWREPNGAYLVMRYLRGGSLKTALEAGAWDLDSAVTLTDQITDALSFAHRQGVVHRDIKPANILLDMEGNAYLSDFGIAKDVALDSDMTETGSVLGSPAYISPEQALSEEITPLTDIYSLGIVLYELLTGSHPFAGYPLAAMLTKQQHEALPSLKEQRPDLPEGLDQVIQQATAKDPAKRYATATELAGAFRQAAGDLAAAAFIPPAELVNPYKGLRPFREADAPDFFGREMLTQELLDELAAQDGDGRLLTVVGPSGSGKSSVVKAGVVPALRQGAIDGSQDWFIVEIMPGSHPFEELEAGLLRIAVNPPESLLGQLTEDERGLIRAVKRVLPGDEEAELLIVVDQFEELFTLLDDQEERLLFLDSLREAASDPRGRVRVILTLRADFYDRPLSYPAFGELVRQNTTAVVPLTSEELGRAISAPAEKAGAQVEPELLATMANDVNQQPGALPLLQYALTELFERRRGRVMTLDAYQEMGGVLGALGRRAEEIYEGLEKAGQEAARQMFLRLVTLGEGVEDTRRRVLRTELEGLAPTNSETVSDNPGHTLMSQVIDAYGRYRLLTFDRDPATRGPTVEVAHEALLREWDRLRGWLDASRDDVRFQRRLAAAAAEWLQTSKDEGFLLRGARLEQFAGWAAGTKIALTQDEQAYLAASIAAREDRLAEEEARRQRELETAQKLAETERQRAEDEIQAAASLRRRAIWLAGALAVAAILAILALFAGRQANLNAQAADANYQLALTREGEANSSAAAEATAAAEAQAQQAIAQANAQEALEAYSQSLAAHAANALENGDTAAALALAQEAINIENPPELSQRLLRQAAYAPGPRRQYLVADLFPDVDGRIYRLAMSPVAMEALIGFEDGTLIYWDVANEEEIHRLEGHEGTVRALDFSPDGWTALSGGSDHAVILWNLAAGEEIRRMEGHDGWVRTVDFSPDGQTAVSGGFVGDAYSAIENPGQLILWDLGNGEEIRRFEGHPSGVVAASFTPDGQIVVGSSGFFANVANEYSLILWDVATGEKIQEAANLGGDNFSLAVNPDGQTFMTGGSGSDILLWDISSGQQLTTLESHNTSVTGLTVTSDGRRALSGDAEGMIILWDLDSSKPLMRTGVQQTEFYSWHDSDNPVLNLAIAYDGRTALSSGEGTLVLWDLVDAGEIRRFTGHLSPVLVGAEFTPDGQGVLTSEWGDAWGFKFSDSNLMHLFDVETGEHLQDFSGHTEAIVMIDVSPDGRQVLTGSQDGTMRLWDLETGEELQNIPAHTDGVYSVAFSPDGSKALSASIADELEDSGISVWDLQTGQVVQRISGNKHHTSLVISNDGQSFFSDNPIDGGGGFDQFSLDTGQILHTYSAPCCTDLALHPDGHSVFLAGDSVVEWDLENDHEIRTYGQHPGARTRVEVSPDGDLLFISALRNTGNNLSLWDLETGEEIRRFNGDGTCCVDIDMSPDGTMAVTPGGGGTAILWDLTLPVESDEVQAWIAENRYVRDLTCEERALYRIEPLCESE